MKVLDAELSSQNAEIFISKLHQKIEKIPTIGQAKLAISISLFASRFPNPTDAFSFHSPFSRGALLATYLVEAQVNENDRRGLAIEVMNVAEPITFAMEVVRWLRRKKSEESVISPDSLQIITSALANRIETLASQGIDFFDEFKDQTPHLLWFWEMFGSKENADKYINTYLAANIRNVHQLLESVVPIAYPMDGSPPHKSEFERHQYDYLQSFVDLDSVYELLKSNFGDKLKSEQYPYDFGESSELRYARQFAWIHRYVLNEKTSKEIKKQDEEKNGKDWDEEGKVE